MTGPDLEGRLAELLLERAEGAMQATQTQEKLTELLSGHSRRPRRWVAGTVAVAAAAAVVVSAWLVRGDQPTTPAPASPTRDVAESVATDYLEALYRYDLKTAEAQLADGAVIDGSADLDEWRRGAAWLRAAGMWLVGHECEADATSAAGTPVHCAFELHGLGSERLGRGPFADNTLDLMVVDARITTATEEWPYTQNGFAVNAWEPFSSWISVNHPDRARYMYSADRTAAQHTPRSIRLWERYVAEYVADSRQ